MAALVIRKASFILDLVPVYIKLNADMYTGTIVLPHNFLVRPRKLETFYYDELGPIRFLKRNLS